MRIDATDQVRKFYSYFDPYIRLAFGEIEALRYNAVMTTALSTQ